MSVYLEKVEILRLDRLLPVNLTTFADSPLIASYKFIAQPRTEVQAHVRLNDTPLGNWFLAGSELLPQKVLGATTVFRGPEKKLQLSFLKAQRLALEIVALGTYKTGRLSSGDESSYIPWTLTLNPKPKALTCVQHHLFVVKGLIMH